MRFVSVLWAPFAAALVLLPACPKPYYPPGGDAGFWQDGGPIAGGRLPGGANNLCNPADVSACSAGSECMFVDAGQGSLCLPGACDVVRQTGCASVEKCTYVFDGGASARGCSPDGTAGAGQPCSSSGAQCLRGLTCVDLTGTGTQGTCQRFCGGDADCPLFALDGGEECGDIFLLPGGTIESPSFCAPPPAACDLLSTQSCAATGTACYSGPKRPTCYAAGSVPLGSPCVYTNDCVPGALCAGKGADAKCRQSCSAPSGSPACSSGGCNAIQVAGATGVGVCL